MARASILPVIMLRRHRFWDVLCCVIACSWSLHGHAQWGPPEAGLPFVEVFAPRVYQAETQNWVADQSARGRLFIGNNDGVLVYDGVRWQLHPVPNETTVRALEAAPDGRVFVGAKGELGWFAPDAQGRLRFTSLLPQLEKLGKTVRRVDQVMALDKGALYLMANLLVHWDGQQVRAWDGAFYAAFQHKRDIYIVREDSGLVRWTPQGMTSVPAGAELASAQVQAVLPLGPGTTDVLLATRAQGLIRFDGRKLTPVAPQWRDFLRDNRLFCATRLPDGHIALGTLQAGVWVVDLQGRLQQVLDRSTGLPDNAILFLYVDESEALWVGTNNGIARVMPGAALTRFTEAQGLMGSVSSSARFAGSLYAGTSNGLFRLEPPSARTRQLSLSGARLAQFVAVPGIDVDVWSLTATPQGLLIGGGNSLWVMDQPKATPRQLADDHTYQILPSRRFPGFAYAATSEGLLVLELRAGRWQRVGRYRNLDIELRTLVEDSAGGLWLGTLYNGVAYRAPAPPDRLDIPVRMFGTRDGLPKESNCNLYSIGGEPVVATRQGIYLPTWYGGDKVRFQPDARFAQVLGPNPPFVLNLRELPDRSVLLNLYPSRRTLSVELSPDGGYRSGLRRIEPLQQLDLLDLNPEGDSLVWIAATEGLVRLDVRTPKRDTTRFRALICKVIRGDSVYYDGAGSPNLQAPEFAHNGPAVRVLLGHTGFDPSGSVQYRYRIQGYDNTWSAWSPEPVAAFTALPAGDYRLQVQVRDSAGQLSASDFYSFQVAPPWYLSWWMLVIYGLAFIWLVTGITMWRSHRLAVERDRLELIVNERTSEIARQKTAVEHALTELKGMQRQLIVSEKMAALGRLVEGMAHQLNTPVGAIKAAVTGMDQLLPAVVQELTPWLAAQSPERQALFTELAHALAYSHIEVSTRTERQQRRQLEQELAAQGHPQAEELARMLVEIQLPDQFSRLLALALEPGGLAFIEQLHRLACLHLMRHTMRVSAQQTERIVLALKQYSSLQAPHVPQPTILQHVLDQVIAQHANRLLDGVVFVREYQGTQPFYVMVHPTDLYQLFFQLVQNACQALPQGGQVRLGIAIVHDRVRISISDTGAGIPAEVGERIFEPFFTTRPDGQGIGLGLDLVRRIAQKHQGSVDFSSHDGLTVFTVEFPLAEVSVAQPASAARM